MEYIHIYELMGEFEGGDFHPTHIEHSKHKVIKKTATVYYFEGGKISRKRLKHVETPNFTRVYMLYPDNELARNLFIRKFNELISEHEEEIKVFKEAKRVVEAFKD